MFDGWFTQVCERFLHGSANSRAGKPRRRGPEKRKQDGSGAGSRAGAEPPPDVSEYDINGWDEV